MRIPAKLYVTDQSDYRHISVKLGTSGEVKLLDNEYPGEFAFTELKLKPFGDEQPICIELPDNSMLQLKPSPELHAWLYRFGGQKPWVRALRGMLQSLIVFILLASALWLAYRWLMPWSLNWLAHQLPTSMQEELALNTKERMAGWGFAPSNLSASKQQEVQDAFDAYLQTQNTDRVFAPLSFVANEQGAMGFALSDGALVLSDELINSSDKISDLQGVFAYLVAAQQHQESYLALIKPLMWPLFVDWLFRNGQNSLGLLLSAQQGMLGATLRGNIQQVIDAQTCNAMLKPSVDSRANFRQLVRLIGAQPNYQQSDNSALLARARYYQQCLGI